MYLSRVSCYMGLVPSFLCSRHWLDAFLCELWPQLIRNYLISFIYFDSYHILAIHYVSNHCLIISVKLIGILGDGNERAIPLSFMTLAFLVQGWLTFTCFELSIQVGLYQNLIMALLCCSEPYSAYAIVITLSIQLCSLDQKE